MWELAAKILLDHGVCGVFLIALGWFCYQQWRATQKLQSDRVKDAQAAAEKCQLCVTDSKKHELERMTKQLKMYSDFGHSMEDLDALVRTMLEKLESDNQE